MRCKDKLTGRGRRMETKNKKQRRRGRGGVYLDEHSGPTTEQDRNMKRVDAELKQVVGRCRKVSGCVFFCFFVFLFILSFHFNLY